MTTLSQSLASLATIKRYGHPKYSDGHECTSLFGERADGPFVRYSDIESLVQGLKEIEAVIAKCGPIRSSARPSGAGGEVTAYLPTLADVQNLHALLAGRYDLIEVK